MTGRGPFDAGGVLPVGLAALEASAGTGKTYALSSLAARFVAERGVPAAGLCIVSFTDAATAELRGRVRARLSEVADHLASGARAGAGPSADPVLARIADTGGDPDESARRLARVRAALAEFDAATITTIHGFCRRVLAGMGGAAADAEIVDGGADIAEVINDLFLQRYGTDADTHIRPDRLIDAVSARMSMPDAVMFRLPADVRPPTENQEAHHLACDAVADLVEAACLEVARRRHARRRRTFDGLLADTRDLLDSADGVVVAGALRTRTGVVLIDEFQDTDRVQWDIFRTAFVDPLDAVEHGPTVASSPTVVLVGDPKQSIYRFRSAEISAYLAAVGAAGASVSTLDVNWRSDGPLLRALETLFDGFIFGSDDVTFQRVRPADGRDVRGIAGAGTASVTLRWVGRRSDGQLDTPNARLQVRRDVVDVVRGLLDGGVTIPRSGEPGDVPGHRPLGARDIAILTRSNADAAALALALGTAGVPAATSSSNSVMGSEAALQWSILLRALEHPGSSGRVRAAALGWFIGRPADEIAALDDLRLDELHDLARSWAADLARGGVPALMASVRSAGLHGRLLANVGGERDLTDVDHIAELLLAATRGRPVGASTLLGTLADITDGIGDEALAPELLARRVDRDDDAVQVLTVHKAKGLEFPVVLCPYLWVKPNSQGIPHGQQGDRRMLDSTWVTGADGAAWNRAVRDANRAERTAEDRRLLYVALTRARHRCYLWWPSITSKPFKGGSLGELLGHAMGSPKAWPQQLTDLDDVVARSDSTFDVEPVPAHRAGPTARSGAGSNALADDAREVPPLEVADAGRTIDRRWRIWSFTSIAAMATPHDDPTRVAAVPVAGGADEPAVDVAAGGQPIAPTDAPVSAGTVHPSGLRTVPGGTAFGTYVHGVLERCDFAHPDLVGHLRDLCADALRFHPLPVDPEVVADGLAGAVQAPLGGPLGACRLGDIARPDRLDELEFHLPLGHLRGHDVGRVLLDHLDADDPLRGWAHRVATNGLAAEVEGMLTGSIDLVMRHDGRYYVADYKTNQLGPRCEYRADELVAAMEHHHYPLQATLYLVALHRYLRWRITDYDPAVHLGGAAYLFVRGMEPATATDARGVFWWTPDAAAVTALDALLAGVAT